MNKFTNQNGLDLLKELPDNSIDLILTDPPYITSRSSGMHDYWLLQQGEIQHKDVSEKWGKKYAIQTDYGEWDSGFTLEQLNEFIKLFYKKLRPGGSCIVFFDFWKMESLSNMLTDVKFSKLRLIEWVKTNPMPTNQYATYLNGAREMAISCVKGSKATFNSKYDKGIYEYPIYQGKKGVDRIHPTQKSLPLFEELIKKHSNEGDIVVDPFGGAATSYLACLNTNRICFSSELDEEYYNKSLNRIKYYEERDSSYSSE